MTLVCPAAAKAAISAAESRRPFLKAPPLSLTLWASRAPSASAKGISAKIMPGAGSR